MFDLADVLKGVPNLGTSKKQLEYIKRELIDPDPNNFYSLTGIDELAANIQLCGLQQPILVRPIDGVRYMVVSGHRRRAAIELLAEDEPEKWEEISCLVERDEASPELQQLRLIYANANTRTMTGAELAEQAAQVEKLLYQLKEQGYEFPGKLRKERNISADDFVTTSLGWHYAKDMDRLTGLEDGSAVSLNDRMPGSIWAREAKRLIETADLLGCSIDYMLGRDVPEKPISDVPNWGTGWRTGDPDKAGTYAVIGYDPGGADQMLESWDWDGEQWTILGAPITDYDFQVRCWIPLPPKIGTCITGMSGSGRCGAAACCSEPATCCLQCDKGDCNSRCGWIEEGGNG